MNEGEFKKQIKFALESTILWADLKDDTISPEDEIQKVLDNARTAFPLKDFTYDQPNNLTMAELQHYYDKWGHMLVELALWSKNWLGDVVCGTT